MTLSDYFKLVKKYEERISTYKRFDLATSKEIDAMIYLGKYYEERDEHENMKKYYTMAIENGNNKVIFELGKYYEERNDYVNMIKYYLMAIEKDNVCAMYNLGFYYEKQEDDANMLKYLCMAVKKEHVIAMYKLGNYYERLQCDENMLKCYIMAAERGNSDAMNNLGVYFQKYNDLDNALKFYLMAAGKDNIYAMYNLGLHYKSENDFINMMKYYKMAMLEPSQSNGYLNNNIIKSINNYLYDSCDNSLVFAVDDFSKLLLCKKYLDAVNLKRLNAFIRIYCIACASKNKIDVKIDDCCVCFDKREHLLFHCKHSVCYLCYDKINSCPLCRKEK